MARQAGFWDYEEHFARVTKGGDPLVTLAAVVDFEPFRYRLEKALKRSDGSKTGRALSGRVVVAVFGDPAERRFVDQAAHQREQRFGAGVLPTVAQIERIVEVGRI